MNSDRIKGQWNQIVGVAKQTWSKITDDELLGIEGDVQRLSGLVQERYGVTREQAESEIKTFVLALDKHLGIDAANDKQASSSKSRSKRSHAA